MCDCKEEDDPKVCCGDTPRDDTGDRGGVCNQCLLAELSRRCRRGVGASMLRWSGCVLYEMIRFDQCRNTLKKHTLESAQAQEFLVMRCAVLWLG